jgi:hypothetical protein
MPTSDFAMKRHDKLEKGDVLLLPFGKTATIQNTPKVGRLYVHYRTEYGPTRVMRFDESYVEVK